MGFSIQLPLDKSLGHMTETKLVGSPNKPAKESDELPCDFGHAAAACVFLLRPPTVLTRTLSVLESGLLSVGGTHGLVQRPRLTRSTLEIIDLVYEVAWQQVSVRQPPRDEAEVEERQAFLRKRVFDLADSNGVDFDTLLDRVLASLPEPLRSHYV
jgi:hypothetical protein